MAGASFNRGESRQDWETPPELIRAVERRFGEIGFDLAAGPTNAKGPAGKYFDQGVDSLSQEWPTRIVCWLNPPFGNTAKWVEKCAAEAARGCRILILLPAAVGSNWFEQHIHRKAFVLVLNGRVTFVGAEGPYPKDLMLCAYGWGVGFDVWDWRTEAGIKVRGRNRKATAA